MNNYIPKILLVGDPQAIQAEHPIEVQVIGRLTAKFSEGKVEFFINGQSVTEEKLKSIPFDYIVFADDKAYLMLRKILYNFFGSGILIYRESFQRCVTNVGFINYWTVDTLIKHLTNELIEKKKIRPKIFHVLDVDSFFLRAEMISHPFASSSFFAPIPSRDEVLIDTIAPIFELEPIHENLYDQVYNSLDEIQFKKYDMIILSSERSIEDWKQILTKLIERADIIFAFYRTEFVEQLKTYLIPKTKNFFVNTSKGTWIIYKKNSSDDLKIVIAIHKEYRLPDSISDCYIPIHAGKKTSKIDLGIDGDDTGDNISELNPWLNEFTVLYWIWKNDRHDFIGLAHYHRFFASPKSKYGDFFPLDKDEALEILEDYDIILGEPASFVGTIFVSTSENCEPNDVAIKILEKYIGIYQPDYLETFIKMKSIRKMFSKNMFVTRWQIFDAYCEWLFSFLIPAAEEFLKLGFEGYNARLMAMMGERCLTLFAIKNRLRIKLLPIGEGAYESDSPDISKFVPLNFVIA